MDHQDECSVVARTSDRISYLPDNVIEAILMYLPARDAVRTSVLARKWRYRWAKLPQLILDETLCEKTFVRHADRVTLPIILYQFLLLHDGPIIKFSLSIPELESRPEFDNLFSFLSRNGIEDLSIQIPTNKCYKFYKLPQSFSKCHQLRHLSLRSCLIKSTPEFKGFSRLITLKLCEVSCSAGVLRSLISSSPFLELLDLRINYSSCYLEIDAPNLKTFKFRGVTTSLFFKKVPLLASVSIKGRVMRIKSFRMGGTCNLDKFFHGLPVLEKLRLGNHLVKLLAAGGVPKKLPTTLVYLKTLKISDISLADLNELSFILCLIRSSPNLKYLNVQGSTAPITNTILQFLNGQDYSDIILDELKEVKLQNVTGTRPEMELIKLLLAKSPIMEKMLIQNRKQTIEKKCKILQELTKFRRASKEAEVIYEEIEVKK